MAFSRLGMPFHRRALAALATTLCLSGVASADIVIDDFNSVGSPNPWPAFQVAPGNNLVTEVGLGDVLGSVRQTTAFGESFGSGSDSIAVNVQSSLLTYTATPGANGAVSLFYTGFPSGLNADFTNETGIMLDFADYGYFGRSSGEGGPADVTVDIYDGSLNVTRIETIYGFGSQSLFFDFTLFDGIGKFNFENLDRIIVTIDPLGSDLDFQLDKISTVSIPGPGGLALLGLAGLAGRRRRRRPH